MPEPGLRPPSIPVSYRLALALSLAFLAHTLLLAGIPSPLNQTHELPHRLVLTLQSSSAEASAATSDGASQPATPMHQDFSVETQEQVTTTSGRSHTAPNEASLQASQPEHVPGETSASNSRPSPASAESPSATPSIPATPLEPERIQRISQSPVEQDPYIIILATHLAEQLERERVPAISRLERTVTMELELRLMPSGALTRARVLESTGIKGIDEAAYRAALAASPYPEPKGESRDRFEVKLMFTPKRH